MARQRQDEILDLLQKRGQCSIAELDALATDKAPPAETATAIAADVRLLLADENVALH